MLYNPSSRFSEEGTPKFKLLTIVLAGIALVVGLFLDFRVLVNVIYVLNGYIGAVLILFMLWKTFQKMKNKKK